MRTEFQHYSDYEFIEPESNDYVIEIRLCGVRKPEALSLAEYIGVLAQYQVPEAGCGITVAHVKYDY